MNGKTSRFLIVSLIMVFALCIFIFSFLAVHMNHQSAATISEVGTIYMTGMSEQISMHFGTTIGLRLSQVEAIVETTPGRRNIDETALRTSLTYSAKARGFDGLAFYSEDGVFDMIYGDLVELIDEAPFLTSMRNGEKKIAVGLNTAGEKVAILGVPSDYSSRDVGKNIALVAVLPVSYISDTLSLDRDGTLVYSHIIRKDGSFVIRSADAYRNNYFERIRSIFNDKNSADADKYVQELEAAMNSGTDYSSVVLIGDERRHLYCTALPYSEWYLATVMPYGVLDSIVNGLGTRWIVLVLCGCAVILMALLVVFLEYAHMMRRQVKALNTAREEAQRANRAKSEFLSNMSHDIRTPMNAIVGMTAIAMSSIGSEQQVMNCLKKIASSSKHLLGLINDVLDMSKIESGKMTLTMDRVSLREMLEGIVTIAQPQVRAKKQNFDVLIHDIDVEEVCCDGVRLNQVLLNLLSNAIKFTPDGGNIQILLNEEASPRGEEYIRVHLKVRDNGIGMSPEFQKTVFESFVREDNARVHRTEGSGLGMAITKYIVDAMEGTIDLKSQLGEGTEFHVTLDLKKAQEREIDMILPSWPMLVVDDDEQLCQSVVASLKEIGIDTEWTLSGESALEMVKKRHQEHRDYQVILLDWKLPEMDGIATAREIRRLLGDTVPVLLISAYDWSEIEDEAIQAGVTGFLSKPLFKSTLFYGLRPYMDGQHEISEVRMEEQMVFRGKRVLVAEDNELNWEVAQELLSELELELEWAENGQICVDKFISSAEGYYDAILMDLRMPVMNGYQATESIRAMSRSDANIPIIAMTADAFSEDVQKCLACGMNAHVSKPIEIRELSRLLEKCFKGVPLS